MLSAYKRKRLSKNPYCSVCGQRIYTDEEVMYVTHRAGRCKVYDFFHPSCLIDKSRRCTLGERKEKEETCKEATNEVAGCPSNYKAPAKNSETEK